MPTHTTTISWNNGSGPAITKATAQTAGLGIDISESVPASSTNLAIAIAFTVAKLKKVFLVSDVDLTLKTNSTSEPQDTIALAANVPLEWDVDGYFDCPFSGNVTAIYATEANGDEALLQGGLVIDPT